MQKQRSHARSERATHINVSLSKEDLAFLDELANEEGRNRSNMFRKLLMDVRKKKDQQPPFQVSSRSACPAEKCTAESRSAS